jgi:hypothetical protein
LDFQDLIRLHMLDRLPRARGPLDLDAIDLGRGPQAEVQPGM